MKNEIKEINIKFPGQILDYVDTKKHLLELFNYITNLQSKIDKAIEYIENFNEPIEFFDMKELLDILKENNYE